ncbi:MULTISPECIES: helix-turn-helix transcriptional regulator [Flavobacteriaceae]|uniref:ArsR/SmtB family transcription factor n=1 Tax=Flavobacteriaceae TaxID=49546 RepID=UPI0010AE3423|nr:MULTISPECIES: helix-turn-helix domain-containing protein [Flavobacteriaceae]NJB37782.1 helix-turn-helix transcriptional regulator [Croceivirga sp. JEA036]TKD57934.1 helix-turn-helix transcriptional regulator [Flavobacterium sp. ASW18X]
MNLIEVNKALSNHVRVNILNWLKNPADNFPPHKELGHFDYGVCLVFIKEKANLSQSTISQYMSQLQKVGLVSATRIGKWTYFKRNEENIEKYLNQLRNEL